MKLALDIVLGGGVEVAPFTGAWIETEKILNEVRGVTVAPFTGAWIETERWKVPCK